jgi:hypothetical protein
VRFRDVIDGLSNTILFGERSHYDPNYDAFFNAGYGGTNANPMNGWGFWAPSGGQLGLSDLTMSSFAPINFRITYDLTNTSVTAGNWGTHIDNYKRVNAFGSQHSGGAQFALADGSGRFLSENINQDVLRGLTTRAGNEVLGDF